MKRIRRHLWLASLHALLVAPVIGLVGCADDQPSTEIISGEVVKVLDHPNRMEDGAYVLDVKDGRGKTHVVDATGWLNIPHGHPMTKTWDCVPITKVSNGQHVSFRLPTAENGTFESCFKKDHDRGYFFRLTPDADGSHT